MFCLVRPVVHTCVSIYFKQFMRQLLFNCESGFVFLLERCAQQFINGPLVCIFSSMLVQTKPKVFSKKAMHFLINFGWKQKGLSKIVPSRFLTGTAYLIVKLTFSCTFILLEYYAQAKRYACVSSFDVSLTSVFPHSDTI